MFTYLFESQDEGEREWDSVCSPVACQSWLGQALNPRAALPCGLWVAETLVFGTSQDVPFQDSNLVLCYAGLFVAVFFLVLFKTFYQP